VWGILNLGCGSCPPDGALLCTARWTSAMLLTLGSKIETGTSSKKLHFADQTTIRVLVQIMLEELPASVTSENGGKIWRKDGEWLTEEINHVSAMIVEVIKLKCQCVTRLHDSRRPQASPPDWMQSFCLSEYISRSPCPGKDIFFHETPSAFSPSPDSWTNGHLVTLSLFSLCISINSIAR